MALATRGQRMSGGIGQTAFSMAYSDVGMVGGRRRDGGVQTWRGISLSGIIRQCGRRKNLAVKQMATNNSSGMTVSCQMAYEGAKKQS